MQRNIPSPLIQHPRISDLIGFNLQMATLRALARAQEALAHAGISPAKVTALALLQMNPGCDQSALGRALRVNRASAMKLVNSLSARGLVERRKGRNLRTKALHLTESGGRLLEEILPILETADSSLASGLSPAEQETLRAMLERLASSTEDSEA